jgi:hypothetical protein
MKNGCPHLDDAWRSIFRLAGTDMAHKHHRIETVVLFFRTCFALKAPSLGIASTPLSPIGLSTMTLKKLTAPVEKVFSPAAKNTGRTKSSENGIAHRGTTTSITLGRLVQKETAPKRIGAVMIIVL